MLRLKLFGGLALELDGGRAPAPGGRRARALLAWLALHPGMHPRSVVAGTFWPDVLEENARASLRVALTEIRRALGPSADRYLPGARQVVGLARDGSVWTDLGEFDRHVETGQFAEAVELAQGELLDGLDDEWVYEARDRHRDRLGEVLRRLGEAADEQGDERAAVVWSRRRAELDSLSEDAGRDLIRRLVASGDHAAAMVAYERLREQLETVLGIAPSPQTRALVEGLPTASGAGSSARRPVRAARAVESAPLTVLCAEIVGSAGPAQRLGAYPALVRQRLHMLKSAAQRSGGRVIEQVGSGLVVGFTSAADAIDCAVAMQRRAEHESGGVGRDGVGLRLGVSVGDAGADASESWGTPADIARRLCQRAEGGQVLVSDLVRRLATLRGEQFRELGALELEGLSGPLAVSELLWAVPELWRPDLPAAVTAEEERPFVGRRDSLDRLHGTLRRARDVRGQLALVSGEMGIGKTRLAARLAACAHDEGIPVLIGRCFEQAAVPYQPFVEVIAPYLRQLGVARLEAQLGPHSEALARLFPSLASIGSRQTAVSADSEGDRLELFAAIAALVYSASRPDGLLLILEDLHWADQPTLLAFRHVLRSLPRTRTLLLGTYRESDLRSAGLLVEVLGDAAREPGFEHLSLGPLDRAEAAELVDTVARDQMPPEVSVALHAYTEGNPFFILEVLRHLQDVGAFDDGSLFTEERIAEAGLPERVKLVITRRLARLPDPTRRLLSLAAVAGREFDFDLLEEVSELSGEGLADALDEAAFTGLIEEDPDRHGRYQFSHSLIRDALYEDVGTTRAALLHRRLGEALERLHAGTCDTYVPQLAYHFGKAARPGDVDKALEYLTRAGDAAIAKLAFEEAAAHYEHALRILGLAEPLDEARRCDLLLALGDAQSSAADVEHWRATFSEAAAIAERLGSADRLAQAAVGFGGRYAAVEVGVVNQAVVELLEKAVAALEPRDGALRAEVMARLAEALTFAPGDERRVSLARQALDMARRVAEPLALAHVLSRVVWATWSPDNLNERLALTREFVELAQTSADHRLVAQGHSWLHMQLLELGQVDAARGEMQWHQSEAARLGDAWRSWITAVYRANQALFEGRFDAVEELAGEALRLGQAAQNANAAPMYGAQLLLLRREQGRVAELAPALEAFVDKMPLVPAWRTALAQVYAEVGRRVEARAEVDRLVRDDLADIPRDVLWLSTMFGLAEAVILLQDRAHAERVYDLLRPYAERCIVLVVGAYLGPVARLLGGLAATCGRDADAVHHFDRALEIVAQVGSEPWLAHTRCDYAQTLLKLGGPQAKRGRDLLEHALASADQLGMTALAARARSLRERLATT